MDFADVNKYAGAHNQSGLRKTIYAAPVSAFLLIKGFKATTAVGDSVTIDGAHTFTSPAGFIKLYTTSTTGKLSAEMLGEKDNRSKKITVEAMHPGNEIASEEFSSFAKNEDWIVIVEESDGTMIQLGSEFHPAEIIDNYSNEEVGNSKRGRTFTIEAFANSLAYYTGVITLKA